MKRVHEPQYLQFAETVKAGSNRGKPKRRLINSESNDDSGTTIKKIRQGRQMSIAESFGIAATGTGSGVPQARVEECIRDEDEHWWMSDQPYHNIQNLQIDLQIWGRLVKTWSSQQETRYTLDLQIWGRLEETWSSQQESRYTLDLQIWGRLEETWSSQQEFRYTLDLQIWGRLVETWRSQQETRYIYTRFTNLGKAGRNLEIPTRNSLYTRFTNLGKARRNLEFPTRISLYTRFTNLGKASRNLEIPTRNSLYIHSIYKFGEGW
ncbi:hypothetical protein ACJJTC_000025 [Scirpophaga incertulas]